MDGHRLGRASLQIDAIYCLLLGVLAVALAPALAQLLIVPRPVVVGVGLAVVAWAGALAWMRRRLALPVALRVVMVANLVAAVGVAAYSASVAVVFAALGVLAVAVDVGLFAGSQGLALRRLRVRT